MRRFWLFASIAVVVVAAAYAPAFSHGLSMCDDYLYVNKSPLVYGGISWSGLRYAFTNVSHAIWMPLSYMSYMLDYSVGWGWSGMHVQNVLWHAASALLLLLVLTQLFGRSDAVLVGTLIWAVHPLRVESVAWIASRKDVISTFFLLAALCAWIKSGKGRPGWFVLSFSLMLVGALAKPSVMVFPAFALAVDFLVTRRHKRMSLYGAIVVASVVLAAESGWAQQAGGATFYSGLVPLWYRVVNAAAALTVYVGNSIWPSDLAIQCMIRYPQMPRMSIVGALVISAVVLWVTRDCLRRFAKWRESHSANALVGEDATANAVLAGLLVYFGCFVPFLGIAGFGVHAYADRFTILPSIGLSIAVTALLKRIPSRTCCRVLGCLLVTALAVATERQTKCWKDDTTLLERTLVVDRRENIDIQRALGLHYWETQHDMEKVYVHLKSALDYAWSNEIRESLYGCVHFLVEACYETGRIKEGDAYYIWLKRTEHKLFGERPSTRLLMAEALSELHSPSSTRIERAESILVQLKDLQAEDYIIGTLSYHIAKAKGDPDEIDKAVAQCASIDTKGKYFACRWAQSMAERLRQRTKLPGE